MVYIVSQGYLYLLKQKRLTMNIQLSIKYALAKNNIKQNQFASGVNVTKAYASAVINNHKKPSLDFVVKSAAFFEMPVSKFIALGEDQ